MFKFLYVYAAISSLVRPLPDSICLAPPIMEEREVIKISFLNTLSTSLSDNKKNKVAFPKYTWENRKQAFLQLIRMDRPAVLGLCELDLRQVESLESELDGYVLVGFSAETGETIEMTKRNYRKWEHRKYGEIVAFLVDIDRIRVDSLECHILPGIEGQKWQRILVEANLYDRWTNTSFVCLASHFDHVTKSSSVRRQSVEKELEILRRLEESKIPWFSVGDRNWHVKRDEENEQRYTQEDFICDFRDDVELGNFGPPGTFPGYLWLYRPLPNTVYAKDQTPVIQAPTVDTGYRSANLVEGVYYYAFTGEFDKETGDLLPIDQKSETLAERNLISDHYLFGGAFRFKK